MHNLIEKSCLAKTGQRSLILNSPRFDSQSAKLTGLYKYIKMSTDP